MNKQVKEIWSNTLPILKSQFTDVTFETIINVLIPSHITDNILYLNSPNSFFKETIEMRYLNTITNTVKTINNEIMYVRIQTEEEANNAPTEQVSNLVNKYTFASFVKAKSNELAYATAIAVAKNPGTTAYNPLFLYGGVGLGKTHLMHSIGNYIKSQSPKTKVIYCSTETFMIELINSIQQNKNQEFRDKYRATDVLLVDDIQFLSDRERTQEEFFHTFNVLRDANKQIVISSDKPPKEIKTLEDRLISRFGQGIIVDLKLPDFETRIAILEKKAESDSIHIPNNVNMFIADNFYSNIRDLEGALNKVIAYSKLEKTPVDIELTQKALKDLLTERSKPVVDVPHIQNIVATYFNITSDEIRGKKRTKNIAYPRQVAMYMCRKLLDSPLSDIGKAFGDRDHSTIIHGCGKITDIMETNDDLKNILIEIEQQIIN